MFDIYWCHKKLPLNLPMFFVFKILTLLLLEIGRYWQMNFTMHHSNCFSSITY